MSTAIDAQVVLALSTKASQVFVQDDTAFSVPLSPVVYRGQDLDRMLAADTAEGMRLLAEFSVLVNTIGSWPVWSPIADRYLWDVYGDVLADADLASASLSAEEQADYARAVELLHGGGEGTESPAYLAYRQCRDAWLSAQQEYNNRKGTAEISGDQAVKDAWAAEEPVLLSKIRDSEQRWATDGRRIEIDEALRTERRILDRSPAKAWQEYTKLFDPATPEVFFANDTNVGHYVPSTLRPSNAVDVPWARITLGRAEIDALAVAAPPELRSKLPADASSTVESLSFEYTSVAVLRPWLSSAVFSSRAWRFSDGTKVLSDGAPSPHGLCPSYVAALVLARSISVTHQPADNGGAPTPPVQPVNFGFLRLDSGRVEEARSRRILRKPVVALRRAGDGAALQGRDPAAFQGKFLAAPAVLERLRADDFTRVQPVFDVMPSPAPDPGTGAEPTPADDIYVLGFICKKLPKCPDPDPGLTW
jgi:hypothetical protein